MGKYQSVQRAFFLAAALLIIFGAGVDRARAQERVKWMNVGNLHNYYSEMGAEIRKDIAGFRRGMEWPADNPAEAIHHTRKGLWIAVKGFTDTAGVEWTHKIAHIGPRVDGVGEFFPIEFKLYSRFDEPAVLVDGIETFDKAIFGGDISFDAIDPTLKADRMIYTKLNTVTGVTVERYVYAFSQEYHQDYHVTEFVLTNTGNIDNDEVIELIDPATGEPYAIDSLYLHIMGKAPISRATRFVPKGSGNGANLIHDFVGDWLGGETQLDDGHHDDYEAIYGDINFRAQLRWHGYVPAYKLCNNMGGPVWVDTYGYIEEGDSVGRLGASEFLGRVTLHADVSATNPADDPGQPSTTHWYIGNFPLTNANSAWDIPKMAEEWAFITDGHVYPHHADDTTPYADYTDLTWGERMARQSIHGNKNVSAGVAPGDGYGPYTLGPGDSVRIVWAECIAGLDMEANIFIGRAFKASGGDVDQDIEFGGESMTKNEWCMTSRDSLFQLFERALANYKSGFNIPQPPLPPKEFSVLSGADKILLSWTPFAGEEPPGGWEIYRARYTPRSTIDDDYQYELFATLPTGTNTYDDITAIRGIDYYYYIQAVGNVNNDPTGNTPTGVRLKSNRYYTQTWMAANLNRPAGEELADFVIVPNPYNLGSAKEVRWPDKRDQVAFLDIPESAIIKIYTERGDLVREIDHFGSGDAYWNLQTAAMQRIVSGVYIVAIEDKDTGKRMFKKFVVIR